MRIAILGSGSQGNCLVVETERTRILVDAGVPTPQMQERLASVLSASRSVDAILLTHGHGDHVEHAVPYAQLFDAPVYCTDATLRTLHRLRMFSGDAPPRHRVFGVSSAFTIGDVVISPMPVPHDAPQVALTFAHGGVRAGLATDLGRVPQRLTTHFEHCDLVMFESNYDPMMLETGPYREALKKRVRGPMGHLSNQDAAGFLRTLRPATREVVLMHISRKNNEPDLALREAEAALDGKRVALSVASQYEPRVFEVGTPRAVQLAMSF